MITLLTAAAIDLHGELYNVVTLATYLFRGQHRSNLAFCVLQRADLRWRRSPEDMTELVELHDSLLDIAALYGPNTSSLTHSLLLCLF